MWVTGRRPKRRSTAYGYAHQLERRRADPQAEPCPFCGTMILPGQLWDLDHPTPVALGGRGGSGRPAHRRCNRQAGARLGQALARARRSVR